MLSGYREQLTAKQAELTRFSGQFSQLKQAYEGRDVLKERAGQLERLLHLRAISKEQDELKERHRKGEEIVVATRREIEVLQEQLREQKERLEQLNQSIPDMKMLSDIREWYNIQQHLREELTRWQEELAGVDKEIAREEGEVRMVQEQNPRIRDVTGHDTRGVAGGLPGEAGTTCRHRAEDAGGVVTFKYPPAIGRFRKGVVGG